MTFIRSILRARCEILHVGHALDHARLTAELRSVGEQASAPVRQDACKARVQQVADDEGSVDSAYHTSAAFTALLRDLHNK